MGRQRAVPTACKTLWFLTVGCGQWLALARLTRETYGSGVRGGHRERLCLWEMQSPGALERKD